MLINRRHVKLFALEMAKARAHKFTRVSQEFFLKCEANLKEFIERIRRDMGEVPVFYIASKPCPSRWAMWDKINRVNEDLRAYAKEKPKVFYIDITKVMLDKDGKPNPGLFQLDRLHMNRKGQEMWIPIVKQAIEAAVR